MDNEITTVSYQCPNCTAPIEHDEATGNFHCYYCESSFTEAQMKEHFKKIEQMKLDRNEEALDDEQKAIEEFTGKSAVYSCPNCGAAVIADELTASTRCIFCHTPVILTGRLSGDYKPDVIIPFSVTEKSARMAFREYVKGKRLLPNNFKSEAQIQNITPIYVPYWLKSGKVDAEFDAEGRIVRTWTTGNTTYTNTKYYKIERSADLTFLRVPCDGSRKIDDKLMESIEPFNYSDLKPFTMTYLSGKAAEKYDVTKEEAARTIDDRIKKASEEFLANCGSQRYTSVHSVISSVCYSDQTYLYGLLPVWFLNYRYGGKDYPFVMNGQTGKHFGIFPVSRIKAFLAGLLNFAIGAVIAAILGGVLLVALL